MRPTRPAPPTRPRRTDPRTVRLLVLLCLACLASAPADARQRAGLHSLSTQVSSAYDADGAPAAVVDASLPWASLVFTRDGGVFGSALVVTVVAERDGRRVGGGVARAAATADTYAETRKEERLHCRVRVPLDGDDPVELSLVARVEGTAREWKTRLKFDPGAGSGVPWYFAGFAWNLPDTGPDTGLLAADLDTLRLDVALLRRPGADPAATTLSVLAGDDAGTEKTLVARLLPASAGGDTLRSRLRVPAAAIPFGLVRVKVRLTAGETGFLSLVPERELTSLRLDWTDDGAWRRHVGWLEGVADGDARGALNAVRAPEARRAAWAAFWAGRPDGAHPTEREHLLRIVEADRRFGEYGRGALSDRGRVYVKHGPPDRIESRTMDLSYPGEWEVWYYRRDGVLYRFYDAYGVGDYRLYDTAPY